MAATSPFFHHVAPPAGALAPVPAPVRYPFHDNDACPVGQEVKRSGHWQYYAPRTVDETRVRCPECAALSRAGL